VTSSWSFILPVFEISSYCKLFNSLIIHGEQREI